MSYLYTDFVTRLPIQENQKVILFFIKEPVSRKLFKQSENENPNASFSYINKKSIPVSYPFIAHYGESGDFILDNEHKTENQAVWNLLRLNSRAQVKEDIPEAMPNAFMEQKIDDLMESAGLCVTTYETFIKAADHLKDQEARQGIFHEEETVAERYFSRKNIFKTYLEASQEEQLNIQMDHDRLTPIQPDIINKDAFSLGLNNKALHEWVINHADDAIDLHIIRFEAFTSYLEIARIPFGPVAGLGEQTDDLDIVLLQVEIMENHAKAQLKKSIESEIKYGYTIHSNQYDAPFVTYYENLVNEVNDKIEDDKDKEDVARFLNKCSLPQLKGWYDTID